MFSRHVIARTNTLKNSVLKWIFSKKRTKIKWLILLHSVDKNLKILLKTRIINDIILYYNIWFSTTLIIVILLSSATEKI